MILDVTESILSGLEGETSHDSFLLLPLKWSKYVDLALNQAQTKWLPKCAIFRELIAVAVYLLLSSYAFFGGTKTN